MNTELFHIKLRDIIDGALSAVIVGIIVGLKGVVIDSHFSLFNTDWAILGNQIFQWGSAAFLGYVGNIFLSNKQGSVLGVGPTSNVPGE